MPQATQSYEDFKETYVSEYPVWASKALPSALTAPEREKVLQGWTVEKPRHNYFNWHQNRTDTRIAELEAKVAWLTARLAEGGSV